MKDKEIPSNPILESALNWQFPPFSEETGIDKVVAFGDNSHRCPIYVTALPPCREGCPAGNDIRGWLTTVQLGRLKGRSLDQSYELAWHEASKTTPFAAVCGRVCPAPCETSCNRRVKEGAVNIHAFERWLGDYGLRHGLRHRKVSEEMRAERVAVIGAGPAGLSCAFQLARHGYPVTVFEANAQAGGMLRYGIPAYKLPRAVLDAEIGAIKEMGVEIVCQSVIGQERGLADLKEEFSAIFIGIGAHGALKLGLAGEECANVISGARFLRLVHGGSLPEVGRQVLVVGGGDSSISAARVARRLGAEVTIVYRRSRAEMPAIEQEITAAEAEGVEILYLVAPLALEVEEGRVVAVECQRMELGAPDASGRRQPLAIVGATFRKECTMLIPAIGQRPQWRDVQPYVGEANWLQPDDDMALADNIYSGGDTLGLRLVTNAIGEGRRAAEGIMARLQGETGRGQVREQPVVGPGQLRLEYYERREPNRGACLPVDQRLAGGLDLELDRGLSQEQFQAEAQRCMSCGLCFECRQCLIFCPQLAISEDPQRPIGEVMSTDYNRCVGCHICAQSCPCAFIQMGMGEGL